MLGLVESAGLAAVAFGPDEQQLLGDADFARLSTIQDPFALQRAYIEFSSKVWMQMGTMLTALANGADLLLTNMVEQQGIAANVAEYYGIPLATLRCHPTPERFPMHLTPDAWLEWRIIKESDAAQRRALGLAATAAPPGIVERGSLQIQAYDELCFPELVAEWRGRRPFVGSLTMELPTDADEDVLSWIENGTPPIYFGFGSTGIESPASTVAMISAACTDLGERALIYSDVPGLNRIPHSDHAKVVGAVNYAAIFPCCRAVVHHGGAGTTAAGMRAGIPTLILWTQHDQPIWAAAVERLKVGSARHFSATTQESLLADLRSILAPRYVTRAREIANKMIKPAESVARAAELLENTARVARSG
jgi:UDP:flavonoid glycosyltransferase YjiC (YdhE family)